MMQAMIFAAGMGTRLKPITDVLPKALVPVGSKPLLQHVMDRLQEAGANHVVVNVHHHAGQIINFLHLASPHYTFTTEVSDETSQLLETGGAIRAARPLLSHDAPILIHNVDILSNVDLKEFCDAMDDADVLLLVSERKTQRYLLFDEDMRLVGWTNIATGEVRSPYPDLKPEQCRMYAFSGIHIFSPRLFPDMDSWPERFPIMDFYLTMCKDRIIRGVLHHDLRLLDVGKLDTLNSAEEFLDGLEIKG